MFVLRPGSGRRRARTRGGRMSGSKDHIEAAQHVVSHLWFSQPGLRAGHADRIARPGRYGIHYASAGASPRSETFSSV